MNWTQEQETEFDLDLELFKKSLGDPSFSKSEFEKFSQKCSIHHERATKVTEDFKKKAIEKENNRPWWNLILCSFIIGSKADRLKACSFSFAKDPEFNRQWKEEMDKAQDCINKMKTIVLADKILVNLSREANNHE